MNYLNEQFSELAVISHRDTGERIEVWPELFISRTITVVELTNAGRIFLRAVCKDYCSEKISADEVLNNFSLLAKEIDSAYKSEIEEKFYFEFIGMLNEN